jgi:DNA polymerase-3 subunit epsilon
MTLVLGYDLETTSADPETCQIVEMGLVFWDTELKSILIAESLLVRDAKISPENQAIHGITEPMCQTVGLYEHDAVRKFLDYAQVSYIVSHNGNKFDNIIMKRLFKQYGVTFLDKGWIDTLTDIPYPDSIKTRKLTHLAAEHGFINPFPHRALFDVMTMLKIMGCYDFEEIVKLSKEPIVRLVAIIDFHQKDMVKALGFKWDSGFKYWYMDLKESKALKMQIKFEFSTDIIDVFGD